MPSSLAAWDSSLVQATSSGLGVGSAEGWLWLTMMLGTASMTALLNRSQSWLAREVGISHGYLSMLVNAGRAPSGRIRERMQKALGMENFEDLFRLEDSDDTT